MPPYLGQLLHLLQARPPTPPVLLYPILHCLLFWIVQLPSLSCNLASSCPSTVHPTDGTDRPPSSLLRSRCAELGGPARPPSALATDDLHAAASIHWLAGVAGISLTHSVQPTRMGPKHVDWGAEAAAMAAGMARGDTRAAGGAVGDSTAAVAALRRRLRLFWRHHEQDFSQWWKGLSQDDKVCSGMWMPWSSASASNLKMKSQQCRTSSCASCAVLPRLCTQAMRCRSRNLLPCQLTCMLNSGPGYPIKESSFSPLLLQVNFLKATIPALPPSRGVTEVEVRSQWVWCSKMGVVQQSRHAVWRPQHHPCFPPGVWEGESMRAA